ncbi:Homer protein isoform 2 [Quillaja saponaria]|uniref:Homer protein isoform 2 n=1 Tax=Quillaja saponaria TaxID=32244 RepID=A0AAD7M0I1_QUISA|nr:Homer protein isoform 2 [Quillaja saponaria]
MHEDQKNSCILPHAPNERELNIHEKKEINKTRGYEASLEVPTIGKEVFTAGSGSTSLHKKPLKVAFCPKEVKRIIESEALLQKNAQSHTIRKIIVFASLGIRHGCEDMYELDFNHFSILKKGEPYMSPNNPGEHVLYENPGVRRKIFYPNQQNQKLCPVQILEEEKAMRPSDASCPSCLFLCIKYGGRTRNLPQNEYVRQRMGRNKLKSFGPLMCRMAMLVHIRSGSFFFKALGITLLFMAGFPDDLVQRETKYRNLDLLQKYYRTDEDAEGEELFLPHPIPCDTQISPEPHHVIRKSISNKTRGRKHTNSISKSPNLARPLVEQSTPSSSTPPTQFGLTGYPSIDTHAMATFQPVQSQVLTDAPQMSNPVLANSGTQVSHNHNLYHMFQPRPANAFMPMMYWPPPTAFPPAPYPSTYGYQSFPSTGNYISFHPWPYYGHPSCSSSIPNLLEGSGKNKVTGEETVSESDNSSSSSKQKQKPATCK